MSKLLTIVLALALAMAALFDSKNSTPLHALTRHVRWQLLRAGRIVLLAAHELWPGAIWDRLRGLRVTVRQHAFYWLSKGLASLTGTERYKWEMALRGHRFDILVPAGGQTNFPGGLRSRGVPVNMGFPPRKGDVYHVDSGHTNADDDNPGTNPNHPLATWDAAVGKCTANNGDLIVISEGHAENITAADGVDLDVAGITTVGLGRGNDTPTFSTTAAAGSITIAAASVAVHNVKVVANFATGTTVGWTITADGDYALLDGIVMRDTSTANEFLKHVTIAAAADEVTIQNCDFRGLIGGSMTNSIFAEGATADLVLRNNLIHVDSSDSVVDHLTAAAVRAIVMDNIIINEDTGAAKYCLEFKTASTGVAARNMLGYNKVDAEIGLGDAMFWFENYGSNTIAESGLLDPATSHAIP